MPSGPDERYDFFLSRRGSVAAIAQEVADVLKENGYEVCTSLDHLVGAGEKRRRHFEALDGGELGDRGRQGGIPKDRRPRHVWRDLLEQLHQLPARAVFGQHKTGGVAAGARQAVDEAGTDRIDDIHEHDRHAAGRLLQLGQGRGAIDQDHVRRKRDQLRRVSAIALGVSCGPASVDPDIAPNDPTRLRQRSGQLHPFHPAPAPS
jgi:hypothetical protein